MFHDTHDHNMTHMTHDYVQPWLSRPHEYFTQIGGSWINFQLRIIVTINDNPFCSDINAMMPCENCEMNLTHGVQVECFVKIGFCE